MFDSIYEERGQLLSEHSNETMHKYTDTAQLLKGREVRKKFTKCNQIIFKYPT